MYLNGDNETYFDNFGVKHISKKIEKLIGNEYIIRRIDRIETIYWIYWSYAKI